MRQKRRGTFVVNFAIAIRSFLSVPLCVFHIMKKHNSENASFVPCNVIFTLLITHSFSGANVLRDF